MAVDGEFFGSRSSKSQRARLQFDRDHCLIIIGEKTIADHLKVEAVQDKKMIFFQDGSQFISDADLQESFLGQHRKKFGKFLEWWEQFSLKKVVFSSIVLLAIIGLYSLALPIISKGATAIFPKSWEQEIGKNAYVAAKKLFLSETQMQAPIQNRLIAKTQTLIPHTSLSIPPEIFFHSGKTIGANALAFPGGPVVITDDLVHLLKKDEEILAIVAHELAHIEGRHSLRQILEVIGVSVMVTLLLGTDETLIEEFSAAAINIWALKKSRDFEKEADLGAMRILDKAGIDRRHFLSALRKLTEYSCQQSSDTHNEICAEESQSSWLSTHPAGKERLEYLAIE